MKGEIESLYKLACEFRKTANVIGPYEAIIELINNGNGRSDLITDERITVILDFFNLNGGNQSDKWLISNIAATARDLAADDELPESVEKNYKEYIYQKLMNLYDRHKDSVMEHQKLPKHPDWHGDNPLPEDYYTE